MTAYLRGLGHWINRKRVQLLMRALGLVGMAPWPDTSQPHPWHKVYPYLLPGLEIDRPGQVWSADITYARLPRGSVYLVAVIDWYSRKVLAWRVSNTPGAGSVWIAWNKPCGPMAPRKSSAATRAASSPRKPSPGC